MPQILPLSSASPRDRIRPTLDGVAVGLVVYWLRRSAGWYLDAESDDGTPIATGVRITPGAVLAFPGAAEGLPPGRFVAVGADAYSYDDLGSAVQVMYLPAAEVEAAT